MFGALILSVAKNSFLRRELFCYAILGLALLEAIGLFDLMIDFLLFNVGFEIGVERIDLGSILFISTLLGLVLVNQIGFLSVETSNIEKRTDRIS